MIRGGRNGRKKWEKEREYTGPVITIIRKRERRKKKFSQILQCE